MVNSLIMFPLIILSIGAIITFGTIAGGNNVTITQLKDNTNCDPIGLLSNNAFNTLGCYLTTGIQSYIYNVLVVQYLNSSTLGVQTNGQTIGTVCVYFPAAGNPCYTTTQGTPTTNNAVCSLSVNSCTNGASSISCTTIGNALFPYGCNPNITNNQLTVNSIQLGFLSVLIVVIGVSVISGFTVLGTGINAASIYIIFKAGGYIILWILFSALGSPLLYGSSNSIPYPFGSLLYLGLSFLFTLGVFQSI